jgi:16S rRNA (guanine966-N2)-methyltransferase
VRISGGRARGIRLKVPPGARPAAERVRQAVFGSLGSRVDGAAVLDLYCGSGAYALEALSRGGARAVGVDSDSRAIAAARANAKAAGLDDRAGFVRRDALSFAGAEARRRGPFDIVFCDPPYNVDAAAAGLLDRLAAAIAPDGVVVIEQRRSTASAPESSGYILVADRRYGDTRVLTYRLGGLPERG